MGNGLSISKASRAIQPKESVVTVLAKLSNSGDIDNDVFDLVREKLEYSGDLHLQLDVTNGLMKEANEEIKRSKAYQTKLEIKKLHKQKQAEIAKNADEVRGCLDVIRTQLAAKGLDTNITKQLSL